MAGVTETEIPLTTLLPPPPAAAVPPPAAFAPAELPPATPSAPLLPAVEALSEADT
jgi:hypothetical protein